MLAPEKVQFFDAMWRLIGTREELSNMISTEISFGLPVDLPSST
jgi:hypothetical protein